MAHYARNREGYKENNDYYTPKWVFDSLNVQFDLGMTQKWMDCNKSGMDLCGATRLTVIQLHLQINLLPMQMALCWFKYLNLTRLSDYGMKLIIL